MRSCWLLALAFLLLPPAPADAERVGNTLTGSVQSISGASAGALAALGVTVGADVDIVFGVESDAVGSPGGTGTQYPTGAILDWTIAIGSFQTTLQTGTQVIVTNDFGTTSVDQYSASAFMTMGTNDLLGIGSNAVMLLFEFGTGAISNENIGQDLSRFPFGTIALTGAGASISIQLDLDGGGGGGGYSAPVCLPTQIATGAALCKGKLLCLGKVPEAGPAREDCIAGPEAKFVSGFDKAAVKALAKGQTCPSGVTGATALLELADATDPLETLIGAGADPNSSDDLKYRAVLYKAAAGAVDKSLKAFAKDARKPDPDKLDAALDKVEAKLVSSVDKANAKADTKGVDTDVEAADVVDAVQSLVESVLTVTGADL